MIRMLDHTADVGFELRADSLESLFDEARRALLMVMFDNPPGKAKDMASGIQIFAPDLETLLVRWLNELIYCVQELGFVPVSANIRLSKARGTRTLQAEIMCAPLDLEAYGWQGEIKSATFHDLNVLSTNEGWSATVILDV